MNEQKLAVSPPPSPLTARNAYLATHLVAVSHLYIIAKLRLSECI